MYYDNEPLRFWKQLHFRGYEVKHIFNITINAEYLLAVKDSDSSVLWSLYIAIRH